MVRFLLCGWMLVGGGFAVSGEILPNDELGMVKVSFPEEVRRDVAAAFGPLEAYDYLLISPEGARYASALKKINKGSYSLLYWRESTGDKARVMGDLNNADVEPLMDRIFSQIGKSGKDDISKRVFLFKRTRNMDEVDWVSVAIRVGDNTEDVLNLVKLLIPKAP